MRDREKTNWVKNRGPEQSVQFAKFAMYALPTEVLREMSLRRDAATLLDVGCAEGDGTIEMAKSLMVKKAHGIDINPTMVEMARLEAVRKGWCYPVQIEFSTADLMDLPGLWCVDFVYCSNVLEHFADPWSILEKLVLCSRYATAIMVPMWEDPRIPGHEYTFREFPKDVAGAKLLSLNTTDMHRVRGTLWSGFQGVATYVRS